MRTHLGTTLKAVAELIMHGISVDILYYPMLKTFDSLPLVESVSTTKRVLTIEELSGHDGMFNQVLHACRQINDVRDEQIVIEDFFYEYGSFEFMCEKVGFTQGNTVETSKSLHKPQ